MSPEKWILDAVESLLPPDALARFKSTPREPPGPPAAERVSLARIDAALREQGDDGKHRPIEHGHSGGASHPAQLSGHEHAQLVALAALARDLFKNASSVDEVNEGLKALRRGGAWLEHTYPESNVLVVSGASLQVDTHVDRRGLYESADAHAPGTTLYEAIHRTGGAAAAHVADQLFSEVAGWPSERNTKEALLVQLARYLQFAAPISMTVGSPS